MRVLLATDGSKHASEAAEWLARFPLASTTSVLVLAAAPLPVLSTVLGRRWPLGARCSHRRHRRICRRAGRRSVLCRPAAGGPADGPAPGGGRASLQATEGAQTGDRRGARGGGPAGCRAPPRAGGGLCRRRVGARGKRCHRAHRTRRPSGRRDSQGGQKCRPDRGRRPGTGIDRPSTARQRVGAGAVSSTMPGPRRPRPRPRAQRQTPAMGVAQSGQRPSLTRFSRTSKPQRWMTHFEQRGTGCEAHRPGDGRQRWSG